MTFASKKQGSLEYPSINPSSNEEETSSSTLLAKKTERVQG